MAAVCYEENPKPVDAGLADQDNGEPEEHGVTALAGIGRPQVLRDVPDSVAVELQEITWVRADPGPKVRRNLNADGDAGIVEASPVGQHRLTLPVDRHLQGGAPVSHQGIREKAVFCQVHETVTVRICRGGPVFPGNVVVEFVAGPVVIIRALAGFDGTARRDVHGPRVRR